MSQQKTKQKNPNCVNVLTSLEREGLLIMASLIRCSENFLEKLLRKQKTNMLTVKKVKTERETV